MPKGKPKRPKLLAHSRPPTSASSSRPAHQSSKATRTTIRNYHTLQKRLSQALADGDTALAESLQAQLSTSGGLEAYQAASTLGQSAQRGGDTSKVLVEWLAPLLKEISTANCDEGIEISGIDVRRSLRILEVGALSSTNALNIPGKTMVRRIDLRSNAPEIEEQDFMTLPTDVPWEGSIRYDVLSLSLVVNFVGDVKGKGLMLQRTTEFLETATSTEARRRLLPALFLVLPLPCVDNSRYLDEDRLREIMEALGYEERHVRKTNKLYYSLWQWDQSRKATRITEHLTKKRELRSGKDRNNFCITIG
jgi:25S rRNA (adenine2142-N1)-methyltransferase